MMASIVDMLNFRSLRYAGGSGGQDRGPGRKEEFSHIY